MTEAVYIDSNKTNSLIRLINILEELFSKAKNKGYQEIVLLCIGTDRSTGDSLGPLIGYKLHSKYDEYITVYGTLESPVHAQNLAEIVKNIKAERKNPYIVAIDASLGIMEHIGYITVGEGSIKPGAGVKKNLDSVGDMYITGIVNFSGFMDFLVLQNTRLDVVMKMADLISSAIKYVSWKLHREEVVRTQHNELHSEYMLN